jgi:hypothetical protein
MGPEMETVNVTTPDSVEDILSMVDPAENAPELGKEAELLDDDDGRALREMVIKANSEGRTEDAKKIQAIVDEIDALKDMNLLKSEDYVPLVKKWMDAVCYRKEVVEKLTKKMNKAKTYQFLPMAQLFQLGSELNIFIAAVCIFMVKRRAEEISYFQPKLISLLRQRETQTMTLAAGVVSYYQERIV